MNKAKFKLTNFIASQLVYVFVFGMLGYTEAKLFVNTLSEKTLDVILNLPPNQHGVYFVFVFGTLLFANMATLPIFLLEIAIKKKFFPNKELEKVRIWIKALIVTSPIYFFVVAFYFMLTYERMVWQSELLSYKITGVTH